MGLSPRVPPRCAHWVWRLTGGLIPLQRSACDYAEVSLSLCICLRLPRGATPILTHPLYRSFSFESRGAVEVNLARYFNADTRNVPYGLVFDCQCPVKVISLPLSRSEIFIPSLLLDIDPPFVRVFSEKSLKNLQKKFQLGRFWDNWRPF